MDVVKLAAAVDAAALESDAAMADRVLLVYISPGAAGLVIHRVGRGTHVLNHGGGKAEFKDKIMSALDALWPELSRSTRSYLRIGADFIAHSKIARLMGGSDDDEE